MAATVQGTTLTLVYTYSSGCANVVTCAPRPAAATRGARAHCVAAAFTDLHAPTRGHQVLSG